MNRPTGVSPEDMRKLITTYLGAARMYRRLVWKSTTGPQKDTFARMSGESMAKAIWWREQLKAVYGL